MFFNLFGGKARLKTEHDKIWRTVPLKLSGILTYVGYLDSSTTRTVLVTYFDETFRTLEGLLHSRAVPYLALFTVQDGTRLLRPAEYRAGRIMLVHSDTLPVPGVDAPLPQPEDCGFEINVIVAEHHPLLYRDDRVRDFAASLPCHGRIGFHESLDSALLARFGGGSAGKILDHMKTGNTDALANASMDRAVRSAQKKIARQVSADRPATSPEEWFRINLPQLS